MKTLIVTLLFAISGLVSAQVVLTPVNRDALLISSNKNALSVSNAVHVLSGLKLGMAQTNIDSHLNARRMTNRFAFSLDRGEHMYLYYAFPDTDSTLVLTVHGRRTGPSLFQWGDPVLESGCIKRLDVETFRITFTNAP